MQAFLDLSHCELDLLTFGQRAVALAPNRLVMNKHIKAALTALNNSITLGLIEPLDGSGLAISQSPFFYTIIVSFWGSRLDCHVLPAGASGGKHKGRPSDRCLNMNHAQLR